MNIVNHPRLIKKFTVAAVICLASVVHANITYQLEPGSTITPYNGAYPTGPSEPLTGTFTWLLEYGAFQPTSLTFQSSSFLLTLNMTNNDLATSIFPSTQTSYFGADVLDLVGDHNSPLALNSLISLGSYEGLANSPTRLVYPVVYLGPIGAGSVIAELHLVAEQVPEPKAQALTLIGLILFASLKLRRWLGKIITTYDWIASHEDRQQISPLVVV